LAAILTRNAKRKGQQSDAAPPLPTDLPKLKLQVIHRKVEWGKAKRSGESQPAKAMALLQLFLARFAALRPVRVLQHYNLQHGPLMSAGIGFNMFFSITGLLTTGFAIAGLVLSGQPLLVDSVIASVSASAPGLLKVDGGEGLVDPNDLLNPEGLGLTAVIAAAVTVFTSLRWIDSVRAGLRGVVGLPPLKRNPVLMKLFDAGTLLLLGVALVLSAGVSLVFGTAARWFVDLLAVDPRVADPFLWLVKTTVPLLLNWTTAVIMFRLAGGLELSRRAFLEGTILSGIGTTVLQVFSTELLAHAGRNPLLASFAVIIGLLIWFNLVSQVYLISASWAAIREGDRKSEGHPRKPTLGSRHQPPRPLP
jgi:membrane protein